MIMAMYDIKCDNCGQHIHSSDADSEAAAAQEAKEETGMTERVVENGSLWQFCSKCAKLKRSELR